MKKTLLFFAVALVAVTVSAQSRQQTFEAQTQKQFVAENVQQNEYVQGINLHLLSQAEIRANRKVAAKATLKAWYNRPKGCFWTTNLTFTNTKGCSGFWAPYISGTAYSKWTFQDASTGATSYSWRVRFMNQLQTFTEPNCCIEYPLSRDTVPELTVADSTSTSTFRPYGLAYGQYKVLCHLNSFPNFPGQYYTDLENRCWSTPKFFALQSDRAGGGIGGAYYANVKDASGAAAGMLLGYNTIGLDEMGVAFEASETPYAIRQAGFRFQGMMIDSTANVSVPVTATIYALDEVPAYEDTTYVTVAPTKVIAAKTINVTYASMKESLCYQDEKTKEFSGILPVPFDETVNIPAGQAIMVAFKGYNTAKLGTNFTSMFSSDNYNEGYGECGYIGAETNGQDVFKGFHNTYFASDCYTAPAILCDIERPFHVFNLDKETGIRNFDPAGQKDSIQFYSSRSSAQWTVQCKDGSEVPAWLGAAVKDISSSRFYSIVNATYDVQPLPENVQYRAATITYAYPGAYIEVNLSQGTKPSGDVNQDGKVDVSDVTALINKILGTGDWKDANCDINGDGKIDVSDITALINMILE